MAEATPRRTPLHAAHLAAGAKLVDFAGWHLPIQYSGVIQEHLAVRNAAGMFDVSHMGEVSVRGAQALGFLQGVTSNDVARLAPGRAHYTALTLPNGAFVDDLLIYMRGPQDYLLVVNAANTAKDVAWIVEHAAGHDVRVADESSRWAQIAVQGPRAPEIVQQLVAPRLDGVGYYRFVETDVLGAPCIVSRTGYTGEDGFELYLPAANAERAWNALLEAGAPAGLVPAGLAARDTLRLEARMALYGNDIDDTTSVLEADLGWIVKLDKGEFVGREVLAGQAQRGVTRKLVGFEMRGRAIARHGYPVWCGGTPCATVTSGTYAPFLERAIGLAYLPSEAWSPGSEIEIEVRGRKEPAVVVATPFYKRPRAA